MRRCGSPVRLAAVKITTLPPLGISPYYGIGGIAW
jgi:hypothetical protein